MADVSWEVLDDALVRALDLDEVRRAEYVASLEAATRDALEPLLRDALADDPLLDHPHATFARLGDAPGAANVVEGARVGPYRIEALAGEGGMGRVYRARRADGAFEQTVALKVVRQSLALAGSDVVSRLRHERDLLAVLDHVGIARLIDGGETEDGVPYLVTEFVDGVPITTYATEHALGVADRVRLLVDVARAVDHAHRRLVVHRDLKPSNVLVAKRDGAARPVVLDFGIAKLLDVAEDVTGGVPLTKTGVRLLTPAYAAPELYDPTATVSTAADVYGLGALLYEVLTGCRPHGEAPGPAMTEPTRPSRAVTVLADGTPPGPSVAARARTLRGDLDTICLKALHPDPARRYATASGLADDLERYLRGHPVEARRESLTYVAGRFARRHRAAVAAGAVALVALVVGLGAALVSLDRERDARAEAEAQTARASEAADLLADLFRTANPDHADGHAVTVAEAAAEGVARVRAVESDPLRAYLLRVLGETYIQLGEPVMADSLLREALAIHGDTASGAEATQVRMKLLATRDALADPDGVITLGRRLYADHGRDPEVALRVLSFMAGAASARGEPDRAVAYATTAYSRAKTVGTAGQRVHAAGCLGDALVSAGQTREALPYLEEAVRLSEAAFGRRDGRTSRAMTSLGDALGLAGETRRAEAVLRDALAFHAERYGPRRVGYVLAALGRTTLHAGRYREAATLLDSAATMGIEIIGPDHEHIGTWRAAQAEALNGAADYAAAETAARDALRIAETLPPGPARALALTQVGRALKGQGRRRQARAALERAIASYPPSAAGRHDAWASSRVQTQHALRRLRSDA